MMDTLQELINGAEAFLNRYIAVGARIEGWKRIDIPEHSIGALREAVVNAVVHRDYCKRGESVRVFYYADRVEVHSPGLLVPGITVEQMERDVVQPTFSNSGLESKMGRQQHILVDLRGRKSGILSPKRTVDANG